MATAVGTRVRGAGAPKKRAGAAARSGPRRRHLLILSTLVLGLVALTLLHVWLRLQVVYMGYVLSTTTKLQNQLEQENRQLKVEIATLTSPERLQAMARSRLGLMPPQKGQVIVLP